MPTTVAVGEWVTVAVRGGLEVLDVCDWYNVCETAEVDPDGLKYASKRCLDSDGQPVEGPMLNICRTSRQVLAEVQPIFAGKTRVSIDIMHPVPRRNSVALAIRFLEDRPHTLQLIRNFELVVEESYDDNLQGYLYGVEAGAWEKLCSLSSESLPIAVPSSRVVELVRGRKDELP